MTHTAPFPSAPGLARIDGSVDPHPMLRQPRFERLHRARRAFSWT
ncbi:DUF485 domain-containing protein, partial [Pseudomonas sp. GW460-13]